MKKLQPRSRHWGITLENYSQDDIDYLKGIAEKEKYAKMVFHDKNEDKNMTTPHLHMYINFKNARQFNGLKKLMPKCHLESKNTDQLLFSWKGYINKTDKYDKSRQPWCTEVKETQKVEEPIYDIIAELGPLPWQKEIMDKLENKPDDRTIFWVYSKLGKFGKTKLMKHLVLKDQDKTSYVNGKYSDLIYGLQNKPRLVLVNLAKCQHNNVSYQGLEAAKDGLFYSTKYECKALVMNCPHVLVCANYPPKWTKMSDDRWEVYSLKNKESNLKRKRNPYADFSDKRPFKKRKLK